MKLAQPPVLPAEAVGGVLQRVDVRFALRGRIPRDVVAFAAGTLRQPRVGDLLLKLKASGYFTVQASLDKSLHHLVGKQHPLTGQFKPTVGMH